MPMSILWLVIGLIVGIALGYVLVRYIVNASTKKAEEDAKKLVDDAKQQAESLRREASLRGVDLLRFQMPQLLFLW